MANELHVMADLETLGNDPKYGLIMALGAVVFDPYGDEIDCMKPLPMENTTGYSDELYLIMSVKDGLMHGFEINDDTFTWWQQPERKEEYMRMQRYEQAIGIEQMLIDFAAFVEFQPYVSVEHRYLWSHGAVFDAAHIFEKYKRFSRILEVRNPFQFRNIRDTRTIYKAHADTFGQSVVWPDATMKHHPIDDARRQAVAVQRVMKRFRKVANGYDWREA